MANQYQLSLKNNSVNPWTFYVYQKAPDTASSNIFSLAWFASPFTVAVGTQITFQWTIDYGFVWGAVGNVIPGVTFNASDCVPGDLNEANTIRFSNEANTPSFSNPVKGSPSGSLVISADNTIPNNKFSVGLSVGGSPAFVMSAGPNLVHKFAPTPTYFIAAGSEIKVGTILDVTTVNPTQQVTFPDNVYSLSYALGTDNRWTII
jgi:rhizosphere induced protein